MAICVRHWDWSETSQTVSLLTREHGVVRGLAKGSRREKGAFSGGIELLTEGQVLAITKSGGTLATLTAWNLVEPFRGLRERLGSFFAGMYLADLVNHLVLDSDPHLEAYDALRVALERLAGSGSASECDRLETVLGFQWALLGAIGTKPDLTRDVAAGGELETGEVVHFVPGMGGFSRVDPDGPSNGWKVRAATLIALRQMESGNGPGGEVETARRGVRFLGAYVQFLVGKQLDTLGPVVGRG